MIHHGSILTNWWEFNTPGSILLVQSQSVLRNVQLSYLQVEVLHARIRKFQATINQALHHRSGVCDRGLLVRDADQQPLRFWAQSHIQHQTEPVVIGIVVVDLHNVGAVVVGL